MPTLLGKRPKSRAFCSGSVPRLSTTSSTLGRAEAREHGGSREGGAEDGGVEDGGDEDGGDEDGGDEDGGDEDGGSGTPTTTRTIHDDERVEDECVRAQPLPERADGGSMTETHFDVERIDVYRCAVDFVRIAMQVFAELPRGEQELRSQLKRAALSIPLNIAEGSEKTSRPDRARFHAIARGSEMECGALLQVMSIAGFLRADLASNGKALLVRIVSMLSRMSR